MNVYEYGIFEIEEKFPFISLVHSEAGRYIRPLLL